MLGRGLVVADSMIMQRVDRGFVRQLVGVEVSRGALAAGLVGLNELSCAQMRAVSFCSGIAAASA